MAESYELRDIEPDLARQQGEDDQRQRLLSKTSDELLDEEIRQLQGEVDGDEPYQPRKSSESLGDRDYDMEEMVNRVSPLSASQRICPSYTLIVFCNIICLGQTTPNTDDPTLPSLTFRSVCLGTIFCILGAAASQVRLSMCRLRDGKVPYLGAHRVFDMLQVFYFSEFL